MNEETLTIEQFIQLISPFVETKHMKYSDSFKDVIAEFMDVIKENGFDGGYKKGYDEGFEEGFDSAKERIRESLRLIY